jgi:serine/threonine protein kinase/tetratricopeptide (TPR) repeat protein
MSEKTPPPGNHGKGSVAARGIKPGPPIDHNSETLHGFDPVATASGPSAGETNADANAVTLKPGGASMAPHDSALVPAVRPGNLDQASDGLAGPTEQTIQASPDATLGGGLDAVTRDFHKSALAAAPKTISAGQTFGQYELLEPIAKGGMGIVYKARQKTLNRIVAIKMILAGQFADQSDIDRFYAEAEAAAALSHPNIVAIHEIGEINGQHFFSMEFIEGKSLSGLIQENPVPPRRAAELTKIITETMEFAHEKGVVHRDLKPANVLLDKRQRPLITDFGLAKQVSNTSQLTMAGSIVGTPSYMPPEQAAGKIEEVGSWSDLYSIGAILYELLTGRPPFRAATPFETIRQVLETEPPSPRLLNPNVPKDLETICLKCLQKERSRRYASCQELSDELGRYLRGLPIHARPIGQLARFWRLCKRHPIAASSIVLTVIALVAATAVSTGFSIQATRALAKAEDSLRKETAAKALAEERKAQADENFRDAMTAVNDLLTQVSENKLKNLPGGQPIREELLQTARKYYERFQNRRQNNPEVENELAASHFRVAKIAVLLGSLDDAVQPLSNAQEMQTRLLSQKPDDPERLKALGDTLTQFGKVWTGKQDFTAASQSYDQAVQIRDRLVSSFSDNVQFQRDLASAHMNAGLLAFNMAQLETDDKAYDSLISKARGHFEKMQPIRERLLARDDLDAVMRKELTADYAMGAYNLGQLARVEDKLNKALDYFKVAAAKFEEVLEYDPVDLTYQSRLATCRLLVGDLHRINHEAAEARQSYERALSRLETLVKENPSVADYKSLQAGLLLNLFLLEKDEDKQEAARAALERARKIYEGLIDKDPSVALYQRDLAVALCELAKEKDLAGMTKKAAEDLAESIRILTQLVTTHPDKVEYANLLKAAKEVELTSASPAN